MKKIFTISLSFLAAGLLTTASAETYKLVKSMDEITKETSFIMVTSKPINGSFHVAEIPKSGNGSINTIEISSIEGETLPEEFTVLEEEAEKIGYFKAYAPQMADAMCLYYEDTELIIGTKGTSLGINTANILKTITYTMNPETYAVEMTCESKPTYPFRFGISSNMVVFKCFPNSWLESFPEYLLTDAALYVEVPGEEPVEDPAPEFQGVPEKVDGTPYAFDLKADESVALPAIEPADLVYTFVSSDDKVVTVDNDAKTLKAVGVGEATITFTTEAVAGKYAAGKGEFKVYVSSQTGVIEIGAAAGEARYYDLNGREIKGNLEKGIYVRLQDGKATKIIVK